jgi:hypothetical protein
MCFQLMLPISTCAPTEWRREAAQDAEDAYFQDVDMAEGSEDGGGRGLQSVHFSAQPEPVVT